MTRPNGRPRDLADGLDPATARRLVELARSGGTTPWPSLSVVDLVEQHAARAGERGAVRDRGESTSYAQLLDRSRRLAAGLGAAGVSAGDRVGVHLERSTDLVVAAFGVLACGGVYVPLDPAQPEDRLRFLAQDAGLAGVVTRDTVAAAEFAGRAWTPGELERSPPRERRRVSADDPAYVIYTSGSTGRPKGVAVRHGSIVALVEATRTLFGFGPDDVWTFAHSPGFDFSIWEIFCCLATGGRVVVVPYWTALSARALHALLAEERVTILSATPTAFAELAAVNERGDDVPVRLVVLGGEAVQPPAVARWKRRFPDERCGVVNMYGITETTVHVTAHVLDRAGAESGDRSIGRPLAGWETYVVGDDERLAPVGARGEIWVAGHGVALGYVGRDDLTAERFVTRTVCGERRRLYRSGDVGRWRDDGTLEFLGRRDRQVKLRGHRVELPEVERALLELDGVARAAVVLDRDVDDPARSALAAYVVGHGLDAATLRAALRERLPEYAIPGSMTVLDRLPTTSNGKVDERALGRARAGSSPDADAPEPSLAKTIARAWRDVAGAEIGVDDGFFDHGGQSITAARLAHALSDAGLPVTVRDVFLHATPRSLATMLAGGVSLDRARRRTRPHPDVLNLVCVPHAGAGPSAFWALADGVPPWLNLVPAGLPGREERILEPPPASVDAAADMVVAQIEDALDPKAAVAVAGQSSGGLVAYETVRRLVHDGRPPHFLLVAGTPAPTAPRAVAVSMLPDEELLELLRRRTGVDHPALRHQELRSLVLPALRADLAADEAYEPPVDLQTAVPMVAVRGRDDEYVGRDVLAGWADAGSDLLVLELAGGHMVLLEDATTFTGVVGRARDWARTRAHKEALA